MGLSQASRALATRHAHVLVVEARHAAWVRFLAPGRTPAEDAWTLPAFGRYAEEVAPASFADVVLRVDDPRRPAMVLERS